jgi:putative transposase
MANTYTQIHIQVVFAVQNRHSLIAQVWKDELYRYITAIVQASGHKLLQINGMPDHLHILFGMRPTQALSDLVQHVKQDSSKWINQKGFVPGKFSWQEGYGGFSYSRRDVPNVIAYIDNQEEHHRTRSFQEEYVEILKDFEIEHDERYIFKEVE